MRPILWTCTLALFVGCLCEVDPDVAPDPVTTDPLIPDPTTDPAATDPGTTTPDTGDVVDLAPTVTIFAPKDDAQFFYDGYDQSIDRWYVDIVLDGEGTDPEDGALLGSSLVWTTDRADLQDAQLATGEVATVTLYSDDCFGATHLITLTGTDSAGNTVSETVEVFIYTLC